MFRAVSICFQVRLAMSTLDRRNNVNNENLPRYKNSQLGVGLTTQTGGSVGKSGGSGESKEHPGGFPDFPKFQKNKSENLSRQVSTYYSY